MQRKFARQMTSVLTIGAVALLLAGCAGAPASRSTEELACLPNQVVVCRGGTVSKVGDSERREPRFCECRARDNIDF